jgi:hypothetical protein
MTIQEIEKLMSLMSKYVVDEVSIGDVKITKTQHFHNVEPEKKSSVEDDDLLFYSAD